MIYSSKAAHWIVSIFAALGLSNIDIAAYAASETDYPTRPITVVTPFATGGTSDAVMFAFNEALSKELGQSIIYEHKPGAFTNIGAEYVANSKPDGYTILLDTVFLVQNRWFGPYPSIDLLKSLTPIARFMNVGGILSARNSLGATDWPQVKEMAISSRKPLSIGSAQADVIISQIINSAKINLTMIPYKGGGPALIDLIGGHIDLMWGFLPAQYSAVKTNKITPIAVTSSKRLRQLPEIPTLVESGVSYQQDTWYGLFVPTGTDPKIINKLHVVVNKILSSPTMQEVFFNAGAEAAVSTREAFIETLKNDDADFQKLSQRYPKFVMPR